MQNKKNHSIYLYSNQQHLNCDFLLSTTSHNLRSTTSQSLSIKNKLINKMILFQNF